MSASATSRTPSACPWARSEVTDALAAARVYLDSQSAATARISIAPKERGTDRPLAAT
ncbi:hypothetical protein [Streptomyces aureus]